MATTKYLDSSGLTYLWGKIKAWAKRMLVSNVTYDGNDKAIKMTKYDGTNDAEHVTTVVSAATLLTDANGVTLTGTQALTNKTYNGYTLGAACAKGVDTSIASGSSSTNVPTTSAVESRIVEAIQAAQVGAAVFKGVVNAGTEISSLTAYSKGWYWVVGTAGTYVGQTCEAGDTIFCIADYSSAYSASDFNVIQTNLDIASITNAEIDTITAN